MIHSYHLDAYITSNTAPWFQSLLVDGIIGGVGGILVLLPVIFHYLSV